MKIQNAIKLQLNSIKLLFLDILFPVKCLGCKKEGEWICEICSNKIKINTEHVCGVCEKNLTPDGRTCLSCKKKNGIDAFLPAVSYKNLLVSKAIHLYKYRFVENLHQPLGNLMIKTLQKTDLPLPNLIIPIPLHRKRLRWRGFNQSALLARSISENLLPFSKIPQKENVLIRKKYTKPQMEIKKFHDRKENIRDAFEIVDKLKIKDKTILLVDDVCTTGSTIFECTKILKQAGAKEVFAIVIARQEIK